MARAPTTTSASPNYLPGPRGLPLLKPPFGSIVAIDMNTGEHRWRIPVGRSQRDAVDPAAGDLADDLGLPARSWALMTKTVMIVVQMGYLEPAALRARLQPADPRPHNLDPHLWVYDKTTGEKLAEIELPANATGSPITYMAGGKQFIVFPDRRRPAAGRTDRRRAAVGEGAGARGCACAHSGLTCTSGTRQAPRQTARPSKLCAPLP